MDQYFHVAALLAKKAEGILTEAEDKELLAWRDSSPENVKLYDLWKNGGRLPEIFRLYGSIDTDAAMHEGRRRIQIGSRRKMWLRMAVSAACVVVAGMIIFITGRDNAEPPLPLADDVRRIPVLVLEDGREVPIDETLNVSSAMVGNICKWESASLVYAADESHVATYHMLRVPRGTQANVTLPDGSRVWLNADSELRFPTQFTDGRRSVELSGEAYFDVAEDHARPFDIALSNAKVIVTGTEFNITDYDGRRISATLVSGAIDFKPESGRATVLLPGQHLSYDSKDNSVMIEHVDTRTYVAWKNNAFSFDGRLLKEIAAELERWYDVEFEFSLPELEKLRMSVYVNRDESLQTLLDLFEKGARVKFAVRDGKIKVTAP